MITPLGTIDTLGRRAGVDFVITELRTLFAKNINTGLLLLEAFSAMFAAITVNSLFVGNFGLGAVQAFALSAALFGVAAYRFAPAESSSQRVSLADPRLVATDEPRRIRVLTPPVTLGQRGKHGQPPG